MTIDSKKAKLYREHAEHFRAIQARHTIARNNATREKIFVEADLAEKFRREAKRMAQGFEIFAMQAEGIGN